MWIKRCSTLFFVEMHHIIMNAELLRKLGAVAGPCGGVKRWEIREEAHVSGSAQARCGTRIVKEGEIIGGLSSVGGKFAIAFIHAIAIEHLVALSAGREVGVVGALGMLDGDGGITAAVGIKWASLDRAQWSDVLNLDIHGGEV